MKEKKTLTVNWLHVTKAQLDKGKNEDYATIIAVEWQQRVFMPLMETGIMFGPSIVMNKISLECLPGISYNLT